MLLDTSMKYDIYQVALQYVWVPKGLSLRCPFWAPTCATWTGLPMILKLADIITSLALMSKTSNRLIWYL